MKKIIVFFFFAAPVFAQEKLTILSYDISVPVEIKISFYRGGNLDSTNIIPGGIGGDILSPWTYSQHNDSFTFEHSEIPNFYHWISSFTLDTMHKQLINFLNEKKTDRNNGSYPHYGYTWHLQFSSLGYTMSGDTLIIKKSGAECINVLDTVFYEGNYTTAPYPGYTSKDEKSIRVLYEDTADFHCSITLLLLRNSNVSTNKNFYQTLQTYTLSNSQINFFCPVSTSPQPLLIYDILGREVSRIEIPAGSSSNQMSSAGYPKGTYFARLGLQTASFVVN